MKYITDGLAKSRLEGEAVWCDNLLAMSQYITRLPWIGHISTNVLNKWIITEHASDILALFCKITTY